MKMIKEALEWYKDAAEAIARHSIVINTTALEATVTTLGLDAGQRAEQALMRVVSKEAEMRLLKRAIFETIQAWEALPGGRDYKVQDVEKWLNSTMVDHINKLRALMIQEPHPDDLAVDAFAEAMKQKLAKKREQGYSGWWDKAECPTEFLIEKLIEHVRKGDPVDMANFCMFLFSRSEVTAPDRRREVDKLEARLAEINDILGSGPREDWMRPLEDEFQFIRGRLSVFKQAEPFPQPSRKDGEEPCGECHIQPGEICDICGAKHAS
jgi:hypothetical protein